MTLTTTVSGVAVPDSRALASADEQTLQEARVLAFDASHRFLYVRTGTITNNNPSGSNGGGVATIKFSAPVSASNVYFVVIANATAEIDAALTGVVVNSTLKSAILSKDALTKTLTTNSTWNAASSSSYSPIPMHGETSPPAPVSSSTSTLYVDLTRMLARINVSVDPAVLSSVFQMNSVRVYNTKLGGYIAPGNTSKTAWDYLHTSAAINPLIYTLSGTELTANALTNAIYTFERPDVTSSYPVILIVGGFFRGSASETYYKVVLMEGVNDFKNLVRNISYNVSINAVPYPGHPTPEEAYNSTSPNMNVTIQEWQMGTNQSITDGYFTLWVNKGAFTLPYQAQSLGGVENELNITTDFGAGWTATLSNDLNTIVSIPTDMATGNPWLTISANSGPMGSTSISLIMPSNPAAGDRTAYVHIKVDKLTYKVKVTQVKKTGVMYIGRFSGALQNLGSGEWGFTEPTYVQNANEGAGVAWQTSSTSVGTTGLRDGKLNTLNLATAVSTVHPAANLCFQKNDNYNLITTVTSTLYVWYLPSQTQLMAAWVASSSFAPDDKFNIVNNAVYWTSTEFGATNSHAISFSAGYVSLAYLKNNATSIRVRCVMNGLTI